MNELNTIADDEENPLAQIRSDLLGEDVSDEVMRPQSPLVSRVLALVPPSEEALLVLEQVMGGSSTTPEDETEAQQLQDQRYSLIDRVDEWLAGRRDRSGRLEPLLKAARIADNRTIEDLAATMKVDAALVHDLESGKRQLRATEESTIAAWMLALKRDDGAEVEALRRSLSLTKPTQSEPAYAGAKRFDDSADEELVERIVALMEKQAGDQDV